MDGWPHAGVSGAWKEKKGVKEGGANEATERDRSKEGKKESMSPKREGEDRKG